MMLRSTFHNPSLATRLEAAVGQALQDGYRTKDLAEAGDSVVGTRQMGDAVLTALDRDGART
jgi:3-isopropylmalate dehydrogenase